jgi:NADH-quinone oxidoreductase subunit M
MQSHILSWITFIPLIGMAVILCLGKQSIAAIKGVALVATFIPLVLATIVYFGMFDTASADYQLVERFDWIPGISAQYFVGIDGLSLPLVWLTTLLLFIAVPASFNIEKAQKGVLRALAAARSRHQRRLHLARLLPLLRVLGDHAPADVLPHRHLGRAAA